MWEKLLIKMLPMIISVVSPTLKELIVNFITEFEKKAKASPSPWDDIAAELLKDLFLPKP